MNYTGCSAERATRLSAVLSYALQLYCTLATLQDIVHTFCMFVLVIMTVHFSSILKNKICKDKCGSSYRVIQNDCRGFNNLSYTIHLR